MEKSSKIKKLNKLISIRKVCISAMLLMLLIGYPFYFLIRNYKVSKVLDTESKVIKAVVIDDESYIGHSPVSHTFYYKYRFKIDDVTYEGDTRNGKYSPGDSIDIEYLPYNPSLNRVKNHSKEGL